MHRIDTSTAQRDKFGQGKNGFTRGNPQTGTPATQLDYLYCDAIQEEIANAIESAGFTLDKSKHDQLATAIKEFVKKGSVKFNSSTDSTSETEAATSLAVKKVNDEVIITKNIANNAQEAAYASVKRSGDNMAGELQINGLRVLVDGDALPATKIVKDEVPLYEVGEHVVFKKRPKFNDSELIIQNDFTQSFYDNGYAKLPNGLFLQWGRASYVAARGSDGCVCAFYTAFPNSCLSIVANDGFAGVNTAAVHPISTTHFRIWGKSPQGIYADTGIFYIAIGY